MVVSTNIEYVWHVKIKDPNIFRRDEKCSFLEVDSVDLFEKCSRSMWTDWHGHKELASQGPESNLVDKTRS